MSIIINKILRKLLFFVSKEEIKKRKIRKIPRFNHFETNILGFPFCAIDSSSFLGQYEELIKRNIYKFNCNKRNPLIIDCGVNIGLSLISFKKMYPEAKIIGFEPDPVIFKIAKKNISNARLFDVNLIEKAVWSEERVLSFFQEGSAGGRLTSSLAKETIDVKTFNLKTILNQEIDFLKIDIEGAEYHLIKDISANLNFVNNIFIEYHSTINEKQNLDEILKILKLNNFRIFIESGFVSPRNPFIDRIEIDGFDNLINIYAFKSN